MRAAALPPAAAGTSAPAVAARRPAAPKLGAGPAARRRGACPAPTPPHAAPQAAPELLHQQDAGPAAAVRYSGSAAGRVIGNGAAAQASAAPPASRPDAGLIVTCFKWPAALGGHEVSVCGSFSNWEPVALHQATPGGDFVRR